MSDAALKLPFIGSQTTSYVGTTKEIEETVFPGGATGSGIANYEVRIPNSETLKALNDIETATGLTFSENEEEFFENIEL